MPAIFGAISLIVGFLRDLKDMFADRTGRAILVSAALLIFVGTLFYSAIEGWSLVDAFYFSVVTLTTVGFGDLSPETTTGKLFTTAYILLGLSLIATFASSIAKTHAQRVVDLANQANDGQDQDNTSE